MQLQEGGTAPTQASFSPVTGWTAGTAANGTSADVVAQTERAQSSLTASPQSPVSPDNVLGNGFRTPNPKSGQYAADNWSLGMYLQSGSSSYFGRCRLNWRV